MSRPRQLQSPVRQISIWVPGGLKSVLEARAAAERKAERVIIIEALSAHLGQLATVKPHPKAP